MSVAHKLISVNIFLRAALQAKDQLTPLGRLGVGLQLDPDFMAQELAAAAPSAMPSWDLNASWVNDAVRDVVLDFGIDTQFVDDSGMITNAVRVCLASARSEVSPCADCVPRKEGYRQRSNASR